MPRVSKAEKARRRRILAAFATRAIYGLRAQRERLREAPASSYDLDYYAHSAWLLREAACQGRSRVGLAALSEHIEALDAEMPNLRTYRNAMTHALTDEMNGWAWFGQFVVKLLPRGAVDYLVDSRYNHHDALERFYATVMPIIDPDHETEWAPAAEI